MDQLQPQQRLEDSSTSGHVPTPKIMSTIRTRRQAAEAEINGHGTVHAEDASWNGVWPHTHTNGQALDNELLTALSSIQPTVIRPSLINLRTATSGHRHHHHHHLPLAPHDSHHLTNGDDSSAGKVKFVNSTVEILQNQIRKEEAPKKKRTRTTPEQLRILQKAFSSDPMPNSSNRMILAKRLGMNARAVQVWFQNRRAKEKLEAKRAETGPSGGVGIGVMGGSGSSGGGEGDEGFPNGNGGRFMSIRAIADERKSLKNNSLLQNHQHYQHHRQQRNDQRHFLHPNQIGLFPDDTATTCGLDYFDGNSFASTIYNTYAMEPIMLTTPPNNDLYPGRDSPCITEEDNGGIGGVEMGSSNYLRFQSLPCLSYGQSNSLGIIFDGMPPSSPPPPSQLPFPTEMIEGDTLMHNDSMMDRERIFCSPSSGEAFLGSNSLGTGIPMPKPRSLSVPDIPLTTRSDLPIFLRNVDLLSIKEEELASGMVSGNMSKRASIAGLPSNSMYEGMQGLVVMDRGDMDVLPDWTNEL